MKCAEAERNLLRYSEGAMGVLGRIAVRIHVARCPTCRERLADIRYGTARLSAALREPVEAPDVSGSVMALLPTAPERVVRASWRQRAVALTAAAGIALGVFLLACYESRRPTSVAVKPPEPTPRHVRPEPRGPKTVAEKSASALRNLLMPGCVEGWRTAIVPEKSASITEDTSKPPIRHKTKAVAVVEPRPAPRLVHPKRPTPNAPIEPQPTTEPSDTPAAPKPDYQVIVVVLPPEPPQRSSIEIEMTDLATGDLTIYSETRDEDGQVYLAEMKFTRTMQEEATQL